MVQVADVYEALLAHHRDEFKESDKRNTRENNDSDEDEEETPYVYAKYV